MKKLFAAIALLGLVPLGACNTIDGAGEDIESAADAVENEVD